MRAEPFDRDGLIRLHSVVADRRVVLPPPVERRKIRQAAALGRREFARIVKIAPSTLADWESGRRVPRGTARDAYAAALAVLRKEAGTPNDSLG